MQISTQTQQPKKGIQNFVNTPWLLITIPLLAAATWLAANTWIITDNINKPYALLAGPVLAASILAVWLVIKFFNVIAAMFKAFGRARQENGTALFFWSTIVVFMAVSVLESGEFFNLFAGAIPGLGYATALVVDLVAVNLMQARLEAVRMGDKLGGRLYLAGVALCAALSAYANLHSALNSFHHAASGELPVTMNNAAPWLACVFPGMILLLSIVADYSLDRTSTRLDAVKYREQEEKRLAVLRVRRDMERDRLTIERDLAQIARDRKGGNHQDRQWFFQAWLRPVKPASVQAVTEQVMQTVGTQLGTISSELKGLKDQQVDYTVLAQHIVPLVAPTIEEHMSNFLSEVEEYMLAPAASDEEISEELGDDSTVNLSMNSTVNLSTDSTERVQETEPIEVVNNRARKPVSKTKKMQAILKRNPSISPAELATRTNATIRYAYRVKDTYQKTVQDGESNTAYQNGHNGHQVEEVVTLGEYTPA